MKFTVNGLSKRYKTSHILTNVNFDFDMSVCNIIALIGPNGIGKTTLMRLMAGITIPNAGDISIDNSTNLTYEAWARVNTIFVPAGERGLRNKLTIYQNLEYFSALSNQNYQENADHLTSLAKLFNITNFVKNDFEKPQLVKRKRHLY
ncbi:ATP-binding cassette domain-containing protein [Bombilactobacillus thymidiniphilus]|uniref:ATP-binding cassette domain-containing protein n=1 Tax=Bombilactobacillus thymidiniphilus TaxID=2923363 RepID=A0ABY4PDJ1_9LACO|nr:ATP-binding cassette domain-containing protein [Bombilactobacillus thymidiniphilus]UQS83607.1 ATP-binding cassette domain-containing protein [Bombilactobacillus thymidiniphilus]UQS83620.1 ATP-binding cassette domain-containing protein [Bombilactobacillus thymidiniphilus]UQS83627.1 ATP-binding cassette domain-containing protein [Bombilactobacillus thymidiniphilus]UQS83640.1 ATP-binding cassette domain-containing protein [Bombilactobacillus thymidiniphilus]